MELSSRTGVVKDCIEDLVKFTLHSHMNQTLSLNLPLSEDFCFRLLHHSQLNEAVQTSGDGQVSPCSLYKKLASSLYDHLNSLTDLNNTEEEGGAMKNHGLLREWTQLFNILQSVNFHLHVQENFLTMLRDGLKTVEGRCAYDYYTRIGSGALILFNKCLLTQVQTVHKYSSFSKMLEAENLQNVLPGVKTVDDGVKVYRTFYTEEKEMSNGVLAIHVLRVAEQPYMPLARILSELAYEDIERLLTL